MNVLTLTELVRSSRGARKLTLTQLLLKKGSRVLLAPPLLGALNLVLFL